MRNWKTTAGFAAAGLASVFTGVSAMLGGVPDGAADVTSVATGMGPALTSILAGAGLLFAGWHARDKDK